MREGIDTGGRLGAQRQIGVFDQLAFVHVLRQVKEAPRARSRDGDRQGERTLSFDGDTVSIVECVAPPEPTKAQIPWQLTVADTALPTDGFQGLSP